MPYSFTQIEKDKSGRIGFVFSFLIFFYFIVALALYWSAKFYFFIEVDRHNYGLQVPLTLNWHEISSTLLIALIVGALHWGISIHNAVGKILILLRAQALDPKDKYHAVFKNIIDEVSVAAGGIKLEGAVIATPAMNAFALAGFDGRQVIGITEGALSRLSRAQLEAVVGHEVAHIVSGDCLETTITTSLFDLYKDLLSTMGTA